MRRLDRSVIFVFIAGAYAPFALKLMGNAWGVPVLSVVGGLAAVGIVITLAAPGASRGIRVGLYLALGWVGVAAISKLVTVLPWEALAMLVLSGVLFSLGGAAYAMRRPDPFPRTFGYHEVFHALQFVATALIYSVVAVTSCGRRGHRAISSPDVVERELAAPGHGIAGLDSRLRASTDGTIGALVEEGASPGSRQLDMREAG